MIGEPGLAVRLGLTSAVFAAVTLGLLVLYSETVAPEKMGTVQVALPNGDVIRDIPDYWQVGEKLNGRVVELGIGGVPVSDEFFHGLPPQTGSVRLSADSRSGGGLPTQAVIGQYRIHRVSGGLNNGVIQVEPVGN